MLPKSHYFFVRINVIFLTTNRGLPGIEVVEYDICLVVRVGREMEAVNGNIEFSSYMAIELVFRSLGKIKVADWI